jgi:hypothetical protein
MSHGGAAVSEMAPATGILQRLLAFSLMSWLVVMSLALGRAKIADDDQPTTRQTVDRADRP